MTDYDCEKREISQDEPGCTLKGLLEYDGTAFAGWQVQFQGERTVQGELEAALSRVAGRPIAVVGAGRTDSGVHALGQVFSCTWPAEAPPARLRHALCRMLGPEMRVRSLEVAPAAFSARFWARSKRYAYTLDFGREPNPFAAHFAWHMRHPLDLDLVRRLLAQAEGTHDFVGFQSAGSQKKKTTVRTIFGAHLASGGMIAPLGTEDLWRMEFHGNAFLYRMVRNLTGTIVEIARGRFPESFFAECLASPGPFLGHCAPAHGLVLVEVDYGAMDARGALGEVGEE